VDHPASFYERPEGKAARTWS